jgi:hypothetical protein
VRELPAELLDVPQAELLDVPQVVLPDELPDARRV